jgi:hypothetical protein
VGRRSPAVLPLCWRPAATVLNIDLSKALAHRNILDGLQLGFITHTTR